MRFRSSPRTISLLLLLAASMLFTSPSAGIEGRVEEVYDGDTIEVLLDDGNSERVRYLLIDTPELHHPRRQREEFGDAAKRTNMDLVMGKRINLELDVQKRDKYGRLLAYVWLKTDKGLLLINDELVRRGLAFPMIIPPNRRYENRIAQSLMNARKSRMGLWKSAEKRHFTPIQVWHELPCLEGHFITLTFPVRRVIKGKKRIVLLPHKGRISLIIYLNEWHRFAELTPLEGSVLKVIGKVKRGYRGAEMFLHDPAQLLSVKK